MLSRSALWRRALELAELDKPLRERHKANIDPNVVMIQTFARSARVGSNGGTAAGLVGDYDTVAQRIAAFHRAGIEPFMLQFQPLTLDLYRLVPSLSAAA
ncbi:alkanesulfonate monooxygenase SsuD/methylene tetrahydromethanopterin reductase-like flavin-dependent oxidoreductase (luciferase family) [Paraburkholderia youngii]